MFIGLGESAGATQQSDDEYDDLTQLQPPHRDTPMDIDPLGEL
jgi:hypothetical protein